MPMTIPIRAAEQRQDQGLDQELGQDVPAARADRLADADLAGPLADRDEHDVHDPDAAHQERDRGNPGQQQGQQVADPADGRQQLGLVGDREVIGPADRDVVAGLEQGRDLGLDRVDLVRAGRR